MNKLRVLRGGLLTTVQDLGRPTFRGWGVPLGGAMDLISHELANRLLGNPAEAATLEMTLTGAEFECSDTSVIAITGADMQPEIRPSTGEQDLSEELSHRSRKLPTHRPVLVPAGSIIRFGAAVRGCRCYVAVSGGIQVPEVMGSRATFLRAGLGGYEGRALKQGDSLEYGLSSDPDVALPETGSVTWQKTDHIISPPWFVRPLDLPQTPVATLRMIPGDSFEHLSSDSRQQLFTREFQISSQSDRMGYRLTGTILTTGSLAEMLSEGTAVGTLQLPPDGNPILLMADSAPTGGYPRIAHVITADLPAAAQLRPGQNVRFELTGLEIAHQLLRQQRQTLDRALCMSNLLDTGFDRSLSSSHGRLKGRLKGRTTKTQHTHCGHTAGTQHYNEP